MSVHRITVVCHDPRHPRRRPLKLLTLLSVRPDVGSSGEDMSWSPTRTNSRSSVPGRNQASHGYDDWYKELMNDPDFMPNPPKHGDGSAGIKTIFECSRCGERFAPSDKERLDAVLTKFWEHKITEIPLTALRGAYTR